MRSYQTKIPAAIGSRYLLAYAYRIGLFLRWLLLSRATVRFIQYCEDNINKIINCQLNSGLIIFVSTEIRIKKKQCQPKAGLRKTGVNQNQDYHQNVSISQSLKYELFVKEF